MGLFDSLKAKHEEKKELKRQEEERKKAIAQQLIHEGLEFISQGLNDQAITKLTEAKNYSPEAVYYLAKLYKDQGDYKKCFELCDSSTFYVYIENVKAAELLAECYRYGIGTNRDRMMAYKTMKKCASVHHMHEGNNREEAIAELFLADCANEIYEEGYKVYTNAHKIIKINDLTKDPNYKDLETFAYDQNENNINKWKEKVDKHLQKAANSGDVESMILVAENSKRIPTIALDYYDKAFYAGCPKAAALKFWRFNNNWFQNLPPEDYDVYKLGKQLHTGSNLNDPDCVYAEALCYAKDFVGDYLGSNKSQYCKWVVSPYQPSSTKFIDGLKRAYELKCTHPGVQVMLAEYYAMGKIWNDERFDKKPMYEANDNVIDQVRAFEMLSTVWKELHQEFVANLTNIPNRHWYFKATYLLGMMYFDGRGTQKDFEKAKEILNARGNNNSITVNTELHAILTGLRNSLTDAKISEIDDFEKLLAWLNNN